MHVGREVKDIKVTEKGSKLSHVFTGDSAIQFSTKKKISRMIFLCLNLNIASFVFNFVPKYHAT